MVRRILLFAAFLVPLVLGEAQQPVALVGFYGFFVEKSHKNHDQWATYAVCKVKNRLVGDFWRFYARSATNCQEKDTPDQPEPPAGTFPVSLLLEAAETAGDGRCLWRPDWPPDMLPDTFRFLGRGGEAPRAAEVSITPADSQAQAVYRFSRNRDGRVGEFPFLLDGEFFQAEFSYNEDSLVASVILKGPGETDPLNLEVLEWEDSRPSLIRVLSNGAYSFVLIQKKPGGILETWYDPEGRLFAACDFTTALQAAPLAGGERITAFRFRGKGEEERYYYDSRGLVTGVSGPRGDFSVLYYLEDLPQYWDYYPAPAGGEEADAPPPLSYSLLWDEETFRLLGLSGKIPGEDFNSIDCRYVYTLDEKGNWIERREIRMIRSLGLLVPSPGTTIKRVLEYGEEE